MMPQDILKSINEASSVIGKTWPLYSFVTSNPLSGYEQTDFKRAVDNAGLLLNTNMFPDASLFRQAWEQGEIAKPVIKELLKDNGYLDYTACYLPRIEADTLDRHQL